jgi:hypothetical protein
MSGPDLAARLHAVVNALLETDSHAAHYLEPPTTHVRKQVECLEALRGLFPAVRAAAQAAGYSARRAERRCKKLQAACVEEQHQTLEYLGAAWGMLPALSGEGASLAARLGAERAVEEVANIVKSSLEAQGCLAPWVIAVNNVGVACERVSDMLTVGTPPAAPVAMPTAPGADGALPARTAGASEVGRGGSPPPEALAEQHVTLDQIASLLEASRKVPAKLRLKWFRCV